MLKSGHLFPSFSHQARFVVNCFFIPSEQEAYIFLGGKKKVSSCMLFKPYGNSAVVLSLNLGMLRIRYMCYLDSILSFTDLLYDLGA